MTKTENLGLNLFEGTDKVSMNKLNENAQLVDEALKGTSASGHKHDASDITSGAIPVARGGTGATDAETARSNIGAAAVKHGHTKADITDFPSSMPASDVPSWAKAESKPKYTASEVGAATTKTYTATVATAWIASGGYYYQDVTISGILATDNPVVDINPGSDNAANVLYGENMCKVFRVTTSANTIRLWATESLASAFPIQLKVVR